MDELLKADLAAYAVLRTPTFWKKLYENSNKLLSNVLARSTAISAATPVVPAKRRGRPSKVAQKQVPPAKAIPATPKRRGRPPKKTPEPAVAEAPAEKPKKKTRKKREWPTCSVDGCTKNVYMPSGAKKMCYVHHMEAGGKPSPLVGIKKKRRNTAAETTAAKPSKPKTKLKKKDKKPLVKPAPST